MFFAANLGSEPSRGSQKKALASASVFFNEAHLRRMKNDAGLCPMKCGFATCGRGGALRFMFAKQTHHTSFASASYRRSRCFVKCSKPLISRAFCVFRGKKHPSFTIAPLLRPYGLEGAIRYWQKCYRFLRYSMI